MEKNMAMRRKGQRKWKLKTTTVPYPVILRILGFFSSSFRNGKHIIAGDPNRSSNITRVATVSSHKTSEKSIGSFRRRKIHPPKQTWNLKMDPWKRRFLLETIISRFHVNFWGCKNKTHQITLMKNLNLLGHSLGVSWKKKQGEQRKQNHYDIPIKH